MKPASTWGTLLLAALLGLGAVLLKQMWASPMARMGAGMLAGVACTLVVFVVLARFRCSGEDSAPLLVRQRYMHRFMSAMGGYLLAVFASAWLLRQVEFLPLRVVLALLPLFPVALALGAMIRYIREVDEMQQRIELEAISFATALVSLLYLTGGFLQSAKVIDLRSSMVMLMVFPMVSGVYGVAKFVVARRYR